MKNNYNFKTDVKKAIIRGLNIKNDYIMGINAKIVYSLRTKYAKQLVRGRNAKNGYLEIYTGYTFYIYIYFIILFFNITHEN